MPIFHGPRFFIVYFHLFHKCQLVFFRFNIISECKPVFFLYGKTGSKPGFFYKKKTRFAFPIHHEKGCVDIFGKNKAENERGYRFCKNLRCQMSFFVATEATCFVNIFFDIIVDDN